MALILQMILKNQGRLVLDFETEYPLSSLDITAKPACEAEQAIQRSPGQTNENLLQHISPK